MNNYPITFDVVGMPSCCGGMFVTDFMQESYTLWGQASKRELASKEEVFKKFESDLKDKIQEYILEDNNYKGGTYLLQATLVTKYANGSSQFPELLDHLKSKGWKVKTKWKNRNTSNEVSLLQKVLGVREVNEMRKELDRDDW